MVSYDDIVAAHQGQHPLGPDFTIALHALHNLVADVPDANSKSVIGNVLQTLLKLQADVYTQHAGSARTRQALGLHG